MQAKVITEEKQWERFLVSCTEKTFLGSWSWGQLEQDLGNRVLRVGIFAAEQLVAVAQILSIKARRGTFLFVPHGPVLDPKYLNARKQVLNILVDFLRDVAKSERALCIRIASCWPRSLELNMLFKQSGFMPAPSFVNPEVTWQLDLSKNEQTLLQEMRKTTRNLINRGLREPELVISEQTDSAGLELFSRLYKDTARRHKFVPFSNKLLQAEFARLAPKKQLAIFLARYKGELTAAAIIVFWQGVAFYHHGASTDKFAKLATSYLLQWRIIQTAKARGCANYNMWGVAEQGNQLAAKHRFAGLSLFKQGFGGQRLEYVKTQDLPLNWRYWPACWLEQWRKVRRRLY